ncbi:Glutamate decarboxylase [Dirofilaria immitis]
MIIAINEITIRLNLNFYFNPQIYPNLVKLKTQEKSKSQPQSKANREIRIRILCVRIALPHEEISNHGTNFEFLNLRPIGRKQLKQLNGSSDSRSYRRKTIRLCR